MITPSKKLIIFFFSHRFTLHPSVSLSAVAAKLPFTYTGADFYALCSDAMLKAVTRQAAQVDAKIQQLNNNDPEKKQKPVSTAYFFDHFATPEDIAVSVTEADFIAAHRELIPSVSAGELAHYERVRAAFEGGREEGGGGGGGGGKSSSRPAPLVMGGRTVSGGGPRSARWKGKGKAVAVRNSDDDDDEYEDDDYGVDAGGEDVVNGKGKGKGKGKAVAAAFQEGTASDDDGLYE